MKAAGLLLFGFVATTALPAGEPAASATSERLKGIILAGLPSYAPPPAAPASTGTNGTASTDPDVLVLPKFSVRERRIPTNDPDVWLTDRIIQQKAMKAYKDSMTPLEWALNCWFVPPFSAPASVRARAAYADEKLAAEIGSMNRLADAIGTEDPKQADALRHEIVSLLANRPPGSK